MITAAQAEGSPYYVGAGKIMQALILAHATDMLGDVPYTEAYQGGSNYTPKLRLAAADLRHHQPVLQRGG